MMKSQNHEGAKLAFNDAEDSLLPAHMPQSAKRQRKPKSMLQPGEAEEAATGRPAKQPKQQTRGVPSPAAPFSAASTPKIPSPHKMPQMRAEEEEEVEEEEEEEEDEEEEEEERGRSGRGRRRTGTKRRRRGRREEEETTANEMK